MTFEQAIEIILKEEGGYVNDPVDLGGETNFGISKRAYPNIDIKNLTRERAAELYRLDYWNKVKADQLPEWLRLSVFDFAVNAGASRAIRTLQKAAGVKQDGIIGPKTLAAIQTVSTRAYTEARLAYYQGLVKSKPIQGKFLRGWTNRANRIAQLSVQPSNTALA